MELLITENGGAMRSAVTGVFIVSVVIMAFIFLYQTMPEYDTSIEADNTGVLQLIKQYRPVIECEEIVYVDYQGDFNIRKIINAKDYDGTDINDKLTIDGTVNTKIKGLYTIYATVIGDRGYSTTKKINVLVE